MQLLKSKEKEIEQLEEKLSSFGEQSGMTGGNHNCVMIYSLARSIVTLSAATDDGGVGGPLSAGQLERCVQQYKTQIMQLDEKVHIKSIKITKKFVFLLTRMCVLSVTLLMP
jgi:hypothetical protein